MRMAKAAHFWYRQKGVLIYNACMHRSWYTNKVEEKTPDSVHQALAYGTLDDIQALKNKVGEAEIKELFLHYPKKIYTLPALNFIKNFVLNIASSIDERKYLKDTPRSTR